MSVDPKAGKYPGLSPYNYCADNPMKNIDPNGKEIKPKTEEDQRKWNITKSKIERPAEGRKLLDYYANMDYDVSLSYGKIDNPKNPVGQISYKINWETKLISKEPISNPNKLLKTNFTVTISEVILDDSKKQNDDLATPAEELVHGRDLSENPEEYYMNSLAPYNCNLNEINGNNEAKK